MATTAEIRDPALRANLEEAERLIEADKFGESIDLCAETYIALMRARPELIQQPPARIGPAAGGGPPGAALANVWPMTVGLQIAFDGTQPRIIREKERHTFSEAVTCFEFVLDITARSQRG
jgi:hypothetical protein